MANEFKVKNGLIVDAGGAQITGGITGSTDFNTIVNKPTLISGSAQVVGILSSLNTYTGSVSDPKFVSIGGSTASLNLFTASAAIRLTNLETTSASLLIETQNLELFSASALSRLTNLETKSSSVDISITNLNASSASQQSSINSLSAGTASVNSFTASTALRLTNLETTTASLLIETQNLELFTASAALRLTNLETTSASVNSSLSNLNSFSASENTKSSTLATYTGSVDTKFTSIGASTSSLNSFTASAALRLTNLETTSASVNISITNLNTYSASVSNSIGNINAFTSSENTKSSTLATYTGSNDTKWSTLQNVTSSLIARTGSYATTGSNSFLGNQTITGSLVLSGSLNVTGSVTATTGFTGSLSGTASWATNAVSSSFAATASSADNFTIRGTSILNWDGNDGLYIDKTQIYRNYYTNVFGRIQFNGSISAYGSVMVGLVLSGLDSNTNALHIIRNNVSTATNYYIGSNTAQNATLSASFHIDTPGQGVLLPRMSSAQRTGSILVPPQGLILYDTGSMAEGFYYYSSGSIKGWTRLLNDTGSQFISGSLTVTQGITALGSLTIGSASVSTENTLLVGPSPAGGNGEGGQILLAASGGLYTSASMLDNWQNQFRILRGSNVGSDATIANWNMHTRQMQLPAYNSVSAFAGTAVANLAVNSSGDVITVSTTGGSVFPYTGNAQINGGLGVTGSIATSTIFLATNTNGAAYLRGGDDVELWDINIANHLGIYGQQDQTVASIKLGSGGGIISGKNGNIGIGTINPSSGSLHVTGSIFAASITGAIAATNGVVSGSSQVIGILSSLNTYTGSNDTTNTAQNSRLTNLESATASLLIETTNLELFSASALTRFTNLESKSASVDISITNLNASSASQQISIDSINSKTGSFATTGSNTFIGNQTISGSVFISGSLTSSSDIRVSGHTLGRGAGFRVENTVLGFEALGRNTTATRNTAVGWYAISASTTNGSNTAVGAVTQRFNTGGTGNSSLGEASLFSLTTGNFNSALGQSALGSVTDGTNNVGIGYYAGDTLGDGSTANSTPDNSIYIGYLAYASQSNGQNEIVIGASNVGHGSNTVTLGNSSITRTILRGSVTASSFTSSADSSINDIRIGRGPGNPNNIVIGSGSFLNAGASSTQNVAIGISALASATNGSSGSVAIGTWALSSSNAPYSTAVGAYAASFSTTVQNVGRNNAFGYASLYNNVSGECNSGIGSYSLFRNQGSYNAALGDFALFNLTSGRDNTSVGQASAYSLQSGSNNTFAGRYAASGLVTGSNNTIIGSIAEASPTTIGIVTGSNNTIIGANISGLATTLNNNIILSDGQGNIRIRASNTGQLILPNYTTTTSYAGTAAGVLAFDSSGNILTIATPGGSATAGGSNGSIQFNDSTALSGSSRFNFDKTTNSVILTGSIVVSGSSNNVPTLQLFGSGSTIFTISGSNSELFKIVDTPTSPILATISSGSLNVLTVTTSSVVITGSLLISGSMTASLQNGFALVGGPNNTSRAVATSSFGGGSGTPGGSNTQIQYNNSNTFGGVPVLTYDGTTLRATGSFTGSFTGSLFGTASFALNGSSNAIMYQTASAASTWVFNHFLATPYPVVTVYDNNNSVIIPQSIVSNDSSSLTITFSSARTGVAVASKGGYVGSAVATATVANALTTARLINGTSFDGTQNITIPNLVSGSTQIKNYGDFATTGSNIFIGNQTITGNLTISSSLAIELSVTGAVDITGSLSASLQTGYVWVGGANNRTVLVATSSFGGGLRTKAGSVANTSFSGNPKKVTVTFSTAFTDTNYAINVTGEDARSWTIETKLAGSFIINTNSNTALDGTTYWIATAYGETA